MTRTAWATVILLALASSWSGPAFGQDKDSDAERLFREGQKLMEERRFGEACPKLDAAYKKDQQLGTLLNLAYCHKEQGATWQAWIEFKEAELKAIEAKRIDRRDFARQRMAELERSLARLAVDVPTKVELTEVLVEDRPIPDAEKGSPFAVEPGQRKFTFRAKGKKPAVALVTVSRADRSQRVTVPEMEDQPKEAPVAETAPGSKPAEPLPRPTTSVLAPRADTTQRTAAYVAGGVGLVGLAIGGIFGLITLGSGCADGQPGGCPSTERTTASSNAAVSTVGFVVGTAAIAAGIVLWLAAPRATPTAGRWLGLPTTF